MDIQEAIALYKEMLEAVVPEHTLQSYVSRVKKETYNQAIEDAIRISNQDFPDIETGDFYQLQKNSELLKLKK